MQYKKEISDVKEKGSTEVTIEKEDYVQKKATFGIKWINSLMKIKPI